MRDVARWRVRAVLLSALFFLACAAAHAQTQEQENARIDRILKPDQNRVNPMQAKPFYGGKGFNDARKANTKSFYFTEKVSPSKSASTRDYSGLKTFWASNEKTETKTAETRGWTWLSKFGHFFSSKKAETNKTWDADKQFASHPAETREYRGPERNMVNRTIPNTDKNMSMNDVRDLLNKNK